MERMRMGGCQTCKKKAIVVSCWLLFLRRSYRMIWANYQCIDDIYAQTAKSDVSSAWHEYSSPFVLVHCMMLKILRMYMCMFFS